MLVKRFLKNIFKTVTKQRLLSTSNNLGEKNTNAFTKVDIRELQLKEPIILKGRSFLPGSNASTFPRQLNSVQEDFALALRAEDSMNISEWGKICRAEIERNLLRFGGILFRGLPLASTEDFQLFMKSIDYPPNDYYIGSALRQTIIPQIFSASDEPPEFCIELHNEMSYLPHFNRKVCFFARFNFIKGPQYWISESLVSLR